MENLRETAEKDLYDCIESETGTIVTLVNPDGGEQIYSANNPLEHLRGQVKSFWREINPETGEIVVINQPVIAIRISSLIRVPQPGEKWFISMQVSPVRGAPMKKFTLHDRAPELGADLGFVKLFLQSIDEIVTPTESES